MCHGGQGDDDVRHDVGQHHLVLPRAQLVTELLVGQHIPRQHGEAVLANAVHGGVFIGHIHRFGVNVHPHGVLRPQAQGGNGQNARAAAQVQQLLTAVDVLLHQLQAQLGGGVGAGAEGEAGVQVQGHPAVGDGLALHPLGDDVHPLTHRDGLIILLPGGGPVLLPQGDGLGLVLLQAPEGGSHLGLALFIVRDIELYPAGPLHVAGQILVYIVPVLAVLLQKAEKFALFLHHQPGHAVIGEGVAHPVHVLGGDGEGHFQPALAHPAFSPLLRSSRKVTS